jgi:glutathione S-transferase
MASVQAVAATPLPELGYWDMRGLAEPIRLLLAHLGIAYRDRRYHVGPPPAYDKSDWLDAKRSLGLAFPNLPYWIEPPTAADDGLRLTQTHAILNHLAETHGVVAADPRGRARAQQALESVRDWQYALFDITYLNMPGAGREPEPGVHTGVEPTQAARSSPRYDACRLEYVQGAMLAHARAFSAELERWGGPWIAGASLTAADFALFECVDQHLALHPSLFAPAPPVAALGTTEAPGSGADQQPAHAALGPLRLFHARVLALPGVAAYRAPGGAFRAEPLHNRYSQFHRGWIR